VSAIAATLVVLLVAFYLVTSSVIARGFASVEENQARHNVQRVEEALQADLAGIQNSLMTWTQWDPAYDYSVTRDPTFLKENVSSTVYTGMQINFLVFIHERGEVSIAGGYDLVRSRELPVPRELLNALLPNRHLLKNKNPNRAVSGFVKSSLGPLLVVAAPVTNTAADAQPRGYMAFARILDRVQVDRLSARTHVHVAVDMELPAHEGVRITPLSEDVIQGITTLSDVEQKRILRLVVDTPRDVSKQGEQTTRWMLASLLAVGLLFGLVMVVVLERVVLGRVTKLSHAVRDITESWDFSRTIEVRGHDEIATLTRSINGLVCAVAEFFSHLQPPRGS
jgi:sensor domain CHASE-containing protein